MKTVKFSMPLSETLQIKTSKELQSEIGVEERQDGIKYELYIGDRLLPWDTDTRKEAITLAIGCQWGAWETFYKLYSRKD